MSLPDTCTRWGDEHVLATFAPGIPDRTENEVYALANPGDEYTVYFTCDGDRRVGIDLNTANWQPNRNVAQHFGQQVDSRKNYRERQSPYPELPGFRSVGCRAQVGQCIFIVTMLKIKP
jgi:hypothetical protein